MTTAVALRMRIVCSGGMLPRWE